MQAHSLTPRLMRSIFIVCLLLRLCVIPGIQTVSLGSMRNVSLEIFYTSSTFVDGDRSTCICYLLSNDQFFSFNHFPSSRLCQFFLKSDQNKSFTLSSNTSSNFHFLSLPIRIAPTTTLLWSFDSTFNDQSRTFNGTPVNNATFSPSTYSGYGSSLSLVVSLRQSVTFASPFLNLTNQSWTFETWIYPIGNFSSGDFSIVTQCQAQTAYRCLSLLIRDGNFTIAFFADALASNRTVLSSTWYHVAFVFNCSTRVRSIYVNGFLESQDVAAGCFQGSQGNLDIGVMRNRSWVTNFNGLIDQVSYDDREKTADEILFDATVVIYYSFDYGLTIDQGPLQLNATVVGELSLTNGRSGLSLLVGHVNSSYLRFRQSRSTWHIRTGLLPSRFGSKPYDMKPASIIHLSAKAAGAGKWCLSLMGLNSTGELIVFSWNGSLITLVGPVLSTYQWTHVAMSYDRNDGLKLYINGTLHSSTPTFPYAAPGTTNYLFVGTSPASTSCATNGYINGQYEGELDEFRLYSRSLTAAEVLILSKS